MSNQMIILLKFKAIHHFLPVLARHDAIGETVIRMQDLTRKWGYESEIFVETIIDQTSNITTQFSKYKENPSDLIIYHHSIGSILSDFTANLKVRKILFYHNITPSHFFEQYDKTISFDLYLGRDRTEKLSKHFDYAMAASDYNRSELLQLGYKKVLPMHYFIDLERFNDLNLSKKILEQYKNTTNILFVGRISPNKKIENIMKVFAYFRILNPTSKLFLLGGSWSVETYAKKINNLAEKLHIEDHIIFINTLTDIELASYYKISDVFLCMSEHEGFCIPLVEAMHFQLPITAYNSSAIPDTLGGSGILINHQKFSEIAEILYLITTNQKLNQEIISKQNQRLNFFNKQNAYDVFQENIKYLEKTLV
jgi:L-malate glycosyltransferase